jgi:protein translocase SecG subunit
MLNLVLAAATSATQQASAVVNAAATLSPQLQQQVQEALQRQMNPSRSPLAFKLPWLTHTFAAIFLFSALLLVIMLAVQTTKQEGLSGTIGGRVESSYRGRLGSDQQIARWTTYVAVTFIVFATLLSISGI